MKEIDLRLATLLKEAEQVDLIIIGCDPQGAEATGYELPEQLRPVAVYILQLCLEVQSQREAVNQDRVRMAIATAKISLLQSHLHKQLSELMPGVLDNAFGTIYGIGWQVFVVRNPVDCPLDSTSELVEAVLDDLRSGVDTIGASENDFSMN